ncbi:lipopolysaccharide biosynthesis protein [Aerosakkonema sp. BLCC-F183]|uniref:lipopolysaccharide biosynthesis protein n=1 Tax=Aerosakkonema sp. BLCC-F183 TaxID=3342834 RepID=UPI0035B80025
MSNRDCKEMQNSKPLSLRRNFSWTFVGNAVYAASQWGMLVVLAKLGSPEMVGQFTLGLAVSAPVVMFTNLQLRQIQATDAKQQYLFGDYLGLRLICTGLALVAIAIITIAAGYRWETSLAILVIGLAKGFESISDVFYGLIQNHERMDRIAMSLMIKGPLSLLTLGVGVYLTGNVLGGAIGLAFTWAFILLCFDIPNGAFILKTYPEVKAESGEVEKSPSQNSLLRPNFHYKTIRKLVWLALPLGFVMMLISLNTNIPRYFIERYWGERELGIFSALSYLMVAGNMVVSALAQSASPRLAKYYAAGKSKDFHSLLLKLLLIGVLLGSAAVVVAAIAGKPILTLLYRPEYAQQVDLFIWLMVAAGLGYVASFLGYGMMAARYFRIQMPLFAVVTGISALTCFWLVPTRGLQGAALALIIGAIVQTVFSLGVIFHAVQKLDKYGKTEEPNSIS